MAMTDLSTVKLV